MLSVDQYNKAVREWGNPLYRFVLKNLRDEDRARDVVQDCFEKLWLKIRDVNPEKVKSYLFTSAYHTLLDILRKEKRMIYDVEQIPERAYSTQANGEIKQWIDKALERLSEIQKAVILLRDYEGYSYKEIGEITGLNESQVKVYIFRGRLTMKEYLTSVGI